jgi:hypothetical protein
MCAGLGWVVICVKAWECSPDYSVGWTKITNIKYTLRQTICIIKPSMKAYNICNLYGG